MPDRIRFLLDEHIPAAVLVGLRQKGVEVSSIQELGRAGLPDSEQIEFARSDKWILVTFDSDFLAWRETTCHIPASFGVPKGSIPSDN